MTPQRIVWHHSAINAKRLQLDEIDAYHKTRDFPLSSLGFYVGYHYLIEYDGSIRQTRKETEIGAHDTGENTNSIGICLAGDFTGQLPTTAQSVAAATLTGQIMKRWKLPVQRIEPHRWDDTTACPGDFLPDNWLIKTYLTQERSLYARLFWWLGEQTGLL